MINIYIWYCTSICKIKNAHLWNQYINTLYTYLYRVLRNSETSVSQPGPVCTSVHVVDQPWLSSIGLQADWRKKIGMHGNTCSFTPICPYLISTSTSPPHSLLQFIQNKGDSVERCVSDNKDRILLLLLFVFIFLRSYSLS